MSNLLDKEEVIAFLVTQGALKFGSFTLKSGRQAPYFINTGSFDDGAKISSLGRMYAQHLLASGLAAADTIFGPAYKGVPLCVATASALHSHFNKTIGFTFNRKEAKTRGEGGIFVGTPLKPGMKVVIVEDVVTAGTTLQEMVPLLRETAQVDLLGVVVLVDRCERGTGELSAVQEVERELKIKVHPLVTVFDIIECLSRENKSGVVLDAAMLGAMKEYLGTYGAKER